MYTEEETALAIKLHSENVTVEEIATKLGKNKRSVIAKLSREGVYKGKRYTNKLGEHPRTKKELVQDIQDALSEDFGIVPYKLHELDKAPKLAIKTLKECIDAYRDQE